MAKYFGLALAKERCLRCGCGNTYEKISAAGDYCAGCGRHRNDLEESVFDQVDLPKIHGRQVEAAKRLDESWVAGFAADDLAVQAEIEADDDALIGLHDWVKSVAGIDFMIDCIQIQQV